MSEGTGLGSGGGGGAGGMPATQDIIGILRKPQTWIRVASLLFSIIVFAAIADRGHDSGGCVFNGAPSACDLGIATGVIAFMASLFFLVMEFAMLVLNMEELKRYLYFADFGFSCLWAFMWFVTFCFLTNEWRETKKSDIGTVYKNTAQGAIAFCFFSIIAWVALAVFGFLTVRQNASGGSGYGGLGTSGGGGASTKPLTRDEPYQEPPTDAEQPVY